jgi:hypothetical protein
MRYVQSRTAEHRTAGDEHPDAFLSSGSSRRVGVAAVRPMRKNWFSFANSAALRGIISRKDAKNAKKPEEIEKFRFQRDNNQILVRIN